MQPGDDAAPGPDAPLGDAASDDTATDQAVETSTAATRAGRRGPLGWARRHALLSSAAVLALVVGGLFTWLQVRPLIAPEYRDIDYSAPTAPKLTARSGETVYRIDPTRSEASYTVDETFVGSDPRRTTGTTSGIAGDLAINAADPSASRVGDIVVDLEQLRSDDSLRDTRIRSAYLESYSFPLATLRNATLSGTPTSIEEGRTYDLELTGDLEIKTTTLPSTWQVEATVEDGRLHATATTHVTMSAYEIGPISLAGLLRTGDDVTLQLRLVGLDPSKEQITTEITVPPSADEVADAPSFRDEVEPVLAANCASCHNPDEMGAHHWTLDTAADAAEYAHAIGVVTTSGYMPPWPASDVGVPLAHSKALDQDTVRMLAAWADAGGPLDVDEDTKITPTPDPDTVEVRPDLTLQMPQPYTGSQAVPNDYRCFVIDPGFTEATFMTGYEFLPQQVDQVHHAQVFRIRADARSQLDGREGSDGKPGYSCFTGAGVGRIRGSDGSASGSDLIAGWAPGRGASVLHDAGVLFQPGDVLVLQVHYHYSQPALPDQSSMVLQTEPGTAPLGQIRVVNPLAPVEIPCAPGVVAPLCDREAAISDNVALYGPAGRFIESGLLAGCGKTPEELTATFATTGIAASSCESGVPADGTILQVLGHMHTIGRSFRMTLQPGTPEEQVLLDIPNWDFDWQMLYELATPIHVTKGQTIRIECTWDRSLDPTRAPKYIVFAEGTEDEMCFSTYSLVPDPPQAPPAGS